MPAPVARCYTPDMSTSRHHTIDYIEFTVRDMAEAQSFFAAALGWTFTDYGPTYAGIQGEGREMGGITVGQPAAGGPLVVLYSDDLEATMAAIREAGGAIVKEPFGFPGGRRFHFTDPTGNELAVWTTA